MRIGAGCVRIRIASRAAPYRDGHGSSPAARAVANRVPGTVFASRTARHGVRKQGSRRTTAARHDLRRSSAHRLPEEALHGAGSQPAHPAPLRWSRRDRHRRRERHRPRVGRAPGGGGRAGRDRRRRRRRRRGGRRGQRRDHLRAHRRVAGRRGRAARADDRRAVRKARRGARQRRHRVAAADAGRHAGRVVRPLHGGQRARHLPDLQARDPALPGARRGRGDGLHQLRPRRRVVPEDRRLRDLEGRGRRDRPRHRGRVRHGRDPRQRRAPRRDADADGAARDRRRAGSRRAAADDQRPAADEAQRAAGRDRRRRRVPASPTMPRS